MATKSEREKMLAGETYNLLDPELEKERQKVMQLYQLYNMTQAEPDRTNILKQLFGKVGLGSIVVSPFYCSYGRNIQIGDHTYINFLCTILDNNKVTIGNHVMVGPSVQIITPVHPLDAESRIQGWETTKPVVIEDNAWIGGGAIVLPGVRIGRNAVVGAGAVVTRSVPANSVVVGNPARVIKEIVQG